MPIVGHIASPTEDSDVLESRAAIDPRADLPFGSDIDINVATLPGIGQSDPERRFISRGCHQKHVGPLLQIATELSGTGISSSYY